MKATIDKVQLQISEAKSKGLDTSVSEAKLDSALSAYKQGDYTKAKQLLTEAMSSIPEAQSTSNGSDITKSKMGGGKNGSDGYLVLGIVALMLIVLVIAVIYFMNGGNKGGYKYKRK